MTKPNMTSAKITNYQNKKQNYEKKNQHVFLFESKITLWI